MRENSWEECIQEGSATSVTEDLKKADSLIKTAKGRIVFFEKLPVTQENVNYIFEGFYTSLIEFLHSLILSKGYKVSNHICLGYYLRDILNAQQLYKIFEDLRYKRNSIVYYGKGMDFSVGIDAIEKCKKILKELEWTQN